MDISKLIPKFKCKDQSSRRANTMKEEEEEEEELRAFSRQTCITNQNRKEGRREGREGRRKSRSRSPGISWTSHTQALLCSSYLGDALLNSLIGWRLLSLGVNGSLW